MTWNFSLNKTQSNTYIIDMKKTILLLLSIFITSTQFLQAQIPVVAKAQSESILIVGATLHIGTGKKIIDGAIGFDNGVINYVGSDTQVDRQKYKTIIDAKNKHIYPAFIAPNSTLGLMEIGAVRATKDYREVGFFNPHIRAIVAYNAESKITTTVRSNGVLMGQITPRGGRISGQSSIVQFDAWDWEDAIVKEDDGMHLNWPRTRKWDYETRKMKDNEDYQKDIDEIEDFIKKSRAYLKDVNRKKSVNLRFQAMNSILENNKNLYLHARDVRQIIDAVSFCQTHKLKNVVLVSAYDAWRVADLLKDNNISVMLPRVHGLPHRMDEDIDLPYKMAKKLQDAGVLFCLENQGDMAEMNTRNLPFLAGTCVAYGLTVEEAIATISLNTAKILGIDDLYGSLGTGKKASLFISTGDALDMLTNNVERAFIDGRDVDMNNLQKMLYEKFQKRVK